MTIKEPRPTEAILEEYATGEHPPVLDETEVKTVLADLEERGMIPAIGIRPLNHEGPTRTDVLLGHDPQSRSMLSNTPGAIIGPYALGGVHSPDGISIWKPGQTAADAQPEARAA